MQYQKHQPFSDSLIFAMTVHNDNLIDLLTSLAQIPRR